MAGVTTAAAGWEGPQGPHECRLLPPGCPLLSLVQQVATTQHYRDQMFAPCCSFAPALPHIQEVAAATKALGYDPEEVDALFSEADTNKDSLISFEEFVQLMRHSYIS